MTDERREDETENAWWADVHALLALFGDSPWRKMELRYRGRELTVSKDGVAVPGGGERPRAAEDAAAARPAAVTPSDGKAQATEDALVPEGCVSIRAPSMGTFYRAPKPGAPPFVEEGQAITPGTELCLIEVMKLFTTLKADEAGTLRRIVPQDGELVQKGGLLFVLDV